MGSEALCAWRMTCILCSPKYQCRRARQRLRLQQVLMGLGEPAWLRQRGTFRGRDLQSCDRLICYVPVRAVPGA